LLFTRRCGSGRCSWSSAGCVLKKKEAENAINKAVAELKIQATMRDYVLRAARENTLNYLVPLDIQQGHCITDTEKYGQMLISSLGAMQDRHSTEKEDDYSFLADQGIDTVLETAVTGFGLAGDEKINPPLVFFMSLYVRLVRTSDGSLLYIERFHYNSEERNSPLGLPTTPDHSAKSSAAVTKVSPNK
jgi:hypothetical protein